MPPVSRAQNRAMQAAKASPAVAKKLGIPQKVAREFTSGLKPGSVKALPEHAKKKR